MLADPFRRFARYAPGILLAAGVGVLSLVVAEFEERFFGHPIIEGLVVARGTGICGSSAIAAVAPVIHAEREHVASSIAFTAILGVVVVVGLPLLITPLHLSFFQYGVLAGLTVYAVPQVLAAAFPVSA